ncbi:MAG TPA: haloacid dehalogenase type II [Burkholderiales bacterium]|nr:haloacid dehalogenase type II [Burkholderiales bacterium]
MDLRALVFDAYGTLFDVHSVVRRCDAAWPGKGAQLSQLWRAKQLEYTWLRTLMERYAPFSQVTRESLAHACAMLGLPLDDETREALMAEYLRLSPYSDVPRALQQLRGPPHAILTNGSPDMIDPLVRASGLAFDAVLSVDALKRFKPAPQVYQLAVERLGVPKESIGFVSSNCWDAAGAKSFGFRVCWINRLGAPADRLGFEPDAILKSLGDLPEVLL